MQAHWTRLSLLQVKLRTKGSFVFNQAGDSCRTNSFAHITSTKSAMYSRRERGTIIYYVQLDKTSLEILQQVEEKFRFELDTCSGKDRQVEYHHVSHQDSEIHAEQKGNLERHEASKIDDRVRWPSFFVEKPKTRRHILRLWSFAAMYCRRGKDAGRATNQQSIHRARRSEGFPRTRITKMSCACDCGRGLVSVGAFFFLSVCLSFFLSFFLFLGRLGGPRCAPGRKN